MIWMKVPSALEGLTVETPCALWCNHSAIGQPLNEMPEVRTACVLNVRVKFRCHGLFVLYGVGLALLDTADIASDGFAR